MLNLTQRLILGCVVIAALAVGLIAATHRALAAAGQMPLAIALLVSLILVELATIMLVLHPVRMLARDARKIARGNLEHRVECGGRDSFGVIAAELNRMAVRLRELRDTEAGRRQMEFQLSDAVLQSIFEPIIVTDGKGHILKVNQAASEVLGEAASDRMALTNTPGGDKILSAIRDAVSMQKPMAAEGEAAMLPMRIGNRIAQLSPAHHAHARLRRPAAGHRDHAGRRDHAAGHRSLQNSVHLRRQPRSCATRCCSCAADSMRCARASAANCARCRPSWLPPPSNESEKLTT